MFPIINLKETGINLRRIMDKRGISAKENENAKKEGRGICQSEW